MRLSILLLFLLSCTCVAQERGVTEEELLGAFESLFELKTERITINGREATSYIAAVRDSVWTPEFADLDTCTRRCLEYLLTSGSDLFGTWQEAEDASAVDPYQLLRTDGKFRASAFPYLAAFLTSRGVDQHFLAMARPSVSPEQLLRAAVRFIYPKWGQPREDGSPGRVQMYTCVGINGWREAEGPRNLLLEAFAYAVMIEQTQAAELEPVHSWFFSELMKMQKAGKTPDEIRTALWQQLENNEVIAKLLKTQYITKKAHLPFTVTGW
jgi:hypothetical protein